MNTNMLTLYYFFHFLDNVNITSNPMVEGVEKLVNDIVQQGKESTVSNVPHLEMEFESEALAYEFYNEYCHTLNFDHLLSVFTLLSVKTFSHAYFKQLKFYSYFSCLKYLVRIVSS